jgi:translation initiation factor IF-2
MAKNLKTAEKTEKRPPIVVVMGHIDHGKTTLLDYIRKSRVAEKESGGITQHAGAYEAKAKDGEGNERTITFIDTPGHEAFSKIRSRGAKIADIAILVVAAEDGVKQQTVEAIDAIKKAKIPFVVAINKIDKETANPEKVKKELADKEVFVEEWGGKTPAVPISAKTGKGIDELLEIALLLADMENLATNDQKNASGFVLESRMDPKRGMAATLIIQNGRLKQGMCVAAKESVAPVRIFEDFTGKPIKEAGASSPVVIVGFNKLPEAGVEFTSYDCKKDAEAAASACKSACAPATAGKISGESENEEIKIATMAVIIKCDVAGSSEAIEKQLKKLEKETVKINILRNTVGDINEDDIKLAASGKNSVVLGFRVKLPSQIKEMAERLEITTANFEIIYELEDWLKKEIEKIRPKPETTEAMGALKVIKIFMSEKNKKIVGCEVVSGKINDNKYAKILRRDFEIGSGRIIEIRKFQNKVSEAITGEQIGVMLQTKLDVAPRDMINVYAEAPERED